MTLAKKLSAGYAVMLALMLVIGVTSVTEINASAANIKDMAHDKVKKVELANNLIETLLDIGRAQRNQVIMTEPEKIKEQQGKIDERRGQIASDLNQLDQMITSTEGRQLFEKLQSARNAYLVDQEKFAHLVADGKRAEATVLLLTEMRNLQNAYVDACKALVAYQQELMDKTSSDAESDAHQAFLLVVGLQVAALLLAFGLTTYMVRSIYRQLGGEPEEAARVASAIAAGKLNSQINFDPKYKDSVLDQMSRMQSSLREIVMGIREAADEIQASVGEMASSSRQIAAGSQTQSEATASMAAAVEEMSVSVDTVASSADEARSVATESGKNAQSGIAVVMDTIEGMNRIASTIEQAKESISTLSEKTAQINIVVETIQKIAEQTNLLALNAAIEAARAGEHGRGFAVVSDEVRKLAEQAAAATSKINQAICAMNDMMAHVREEMDHTVEITQTGVRTARVAEESINAISSASTQIVHTVDGIASALSEQSMASRDIAQSVERIATMTEENSQAVESSSQQAELVHQRAGQLVTSVSRFEV